MKRMSKNCCSILVGCMTLAPLALRAEVTEADKHFLKDAAQSDVNEIKLSEIAEQKGSTPAVKAFARKMVKDHTTLTVKMRPFAEAWMIPPPAGLDAEHRVEFDKLNGLSGAEFDKEYLSAMAMDHHKALDEFTTEANTTTYLKFKKAVLNGKAVVAMHTSMADKMSGM